MTPSEQLERRLAALSPEKRELVRRRLQATAAATTAAIPKQPRDQHLPLSSAQRRLWFLSQLEGPSATYNVAVALRLSGRVDRQRLESAMRRIIARHETLRTNFVRSAGGDPGQRISPPEAADAFRVAVETVRHHDRSAAEASMVAMAQTDARRPFDLASDWLVRLTLVEHDTAAPLLVFVAHHIVTDGWSMNLLVRELADAYRSDAALPELPIQYADYAAWESRELTGAALDRSVAWWRDALADTPPALAIPTDRPRPSTLTYHGGEQRLAIDAALTDQLRGLAGQERVSMFSATLAITAMMLGRYAVQDDVVIGCPLANRPLRETQDLIGFFVNTLPMRIQLRAGESFRSLLTRTHAAVAAVVEHQSVPFERLIDALDVARDPSRSPIYQAVLAYQPAAEAALDLNGVRATPVPIDVGVAKFELTFILDETDAGCAGSLQYNADLFDASTAGRMGSHFVELVRSAVTSPDAPIATLSMMPAAERTTVLDQFAGTATAYPRDASVSSLFSEVARRTPDAIALVTSAEQVSYAELDRRSSAVAAALQARGVARGDIVALCAPRSIEFIIGILGVFKTGAVYVPIDVHYPESRVSFILQDTGARVVLVHGAGPQSLPDNCTSLSVSDAERENTALTPVEIGGGDGAYMLFTSGSTGEPKGVLVPHRAIVRLVRDTNWMAIGEGDTVALLAAVSFDAITAEIWAPLLNGGRLAIGAAQQPTLAEIGELITTHQVTAMWLTASLFNVMVDERLDDLVNIRHMMTGGDVVSAPHALKLARAMKSGIVMNGYGPTENTTFTCCYNVDPGREYPNGIPIGRPIANTFVYILDAAGHPVPIGVPGELYCGGDGVALGYHHRDDLTRERFVANPFGEGRLYRTGDAARWLDDGTVEYLGRLDDQVKIRGYRIEPRETEAAIQQQPGVAQAAVIVHRGANGPELIAYVVPSEPDAAIADRVAAALRSTLPDFMLPSAIVALEALPLTKNGKLDRNALPLPDRQSRGDLRVAPSTATEIALAAIFEELLDIEGPGSNDSFFALGGHSLSATQLVSRVRNTLGAQLSLRQVFDTPDIASLAAAIDGARPAAASVIPTVDRRQPIPLSFAQRRLWFLNRLEPDNPFYNIAIALQLDGRIDPAALQLALNDIVERHEILRTTYHERDGEPVQQIHAHTPIPLAQQHVPAEELDRTAREEARRPFDLESGPMMRATLASLGDDRHALLITIHHIAADGWSMGVLVNELTMAYAARTAGETASLRPLPIQYADFAAWQHDWIGGADCARANDYWKTQLAGYPAELSLPADRPRPAVQSFAGGSIRFEIDPSTSAHLDALSRDCDATLFMTLLAAFAAVLSRQSGQHDLMIGSPVACRSRAELEPLVGFFVNTLALRVDTSGDPTFRTLIDRARQTALGAYAHQDLPFDRLVDDLQPVRDLSRNPLFQVMFALQNAPIEPVALTGITVTPLDYERSTAQFDIVLDMWQRPEGLLGVIEFSTALFDHSTMTRLISQLRTLLAGAVANPDSRLSALPVLGDHERRALLDGFNNDHESFPIDRTLHQLVEEQVASGPDRIAGVEGSTTITYGELNARANRMAHRLRTLGVGRNDFVGVLLERGLDFLTAMLAAMKAGAAYVPIDPSYPPDRIEYMVRHSRAKVLITRRRLLAGTIADAAKDIRCLIPEEDACVNESAANPPAINAPADRAYMLYTSGSTGLPKGAILRHNGKINHIYAQFKALRFHRDSIFLQTAPASSDISVWQFIGPLLIGGRTVIVDYETMCDPAELWRVIRQSRATVIELVPVAMTALLEHVAQQPDSDRATALEFAMITGEAASPAIINRWIELFPRVPIVNAYGPTEAADDVCQEIITRPLPSNARGVPIGKPLSNLWMYVLDAQLNLVPIGVPGEICVSGVGVGEGYWQDPDRTRQSFVPNPFDDGRRGEVLYRTGDIGFWRADGTLECLSRTDHQIKIRGFRIEAGEIESVLASHPAVRDVVVVARDAGDGEKRLAAYLTPQHASPDIAGELDRIRGEQVALWTDLHQSEYTQTLDYGDPTFNVIGWDSTYTGEPLPKADMREYVDHTVGRVRSVSPRRLLEIGCGSGLIMFGIVPHLEEYHGLDLSEVAIDRLKSLQQSADIQARVPNIERASLRAGRADDLSWLADGSVDTVIFPSVLQYFPGLDYLRQVLDEVMRVLTPNGSIVFGDVRSLPLLDTFHASVTLFKSADTSTAPDIIQKFRERSLHEQEMAIDPAFFQTLRTRYAVAMDVAVMPKRGEHQNEMTRFRYDVIVRLGRDAAAPAVSPRDWSRERTTLDALRATLTSDRPASLAFANIPNARVRDEHALLGQLGRVPAGTTAADLRRSLSHGRADAIDPEQLILLGEAHGYAVHLSMARSAADGSFDAVLTRLDQQGATDRPAFATAAPDAGARLANDPLHERLARMIAPKLREFVKARVPHYMVPADIVVLDRMPTTPAGKIDRAALPAPPQTAIVETAFRAPQTATEQAVAEIWRQVLDLDRCGLGQNFFDSGGHSLKATQVISRVRQQLGVELPLRAVFAHPTVEELATAVDEAARSTAAPIPRVEHADHYAVSAAQRRLWILSQLEDGSVAYNMPASLLIEGPLNVERLQAAFAATIARHESLRTTFAVINGEPRQRIDDGSHVRLDVRDLSSEADPIAMARAAASADASRPFDLANGPLVRASLLKVGAQRHIILFNIHHIVSDDWSMGVLIREVMQGYGAIEPEPLRLQYKDFAAWHATEIADGGAHREYWLERLSGSLPILELPADRPRPAVKTYRGRSITATIPADRVAPLRALARRCGSTLFMTLLAASKTLLHRYTGATDIIVASPASGREHPDLEDQIGFYINTLALRDQLAPEQTFTQLLADVTRNATAAIEHQSYPFDRLVDELSLRRDPSRMPICDVAVVMASAGSPQFSLPGLNVRPFLEDYATSKYDVHFVFDETPAGDLQTALVYNPDLFDDDRIERMLAHLHVLLESIVDDPDSAIAALEILPASEEQQLLVAFNPQPAQLPPAQTLTGWFGRSAQQFDERIAVSLDRDGARVEMSYAELDRRSTALAQQLRSQGVERGSFVGLFIERSPEAIVGILGILKAGAAYVPIDPTYPEDRIRFIVADAGIRIVVCANSNAASMFAGENVSLIAIDNAMAGGAAPVAGPAPADPAYMIYTSGSTGRPKGVMVSHANATRLFSATADWFQFDHTDVWTVFHSLAFDFSVWEIWGALLYGGRAVMVPHDVARSPEALAVLLERERVTSLSQTPSAFSALIAQQTRAGWPLQQSLRHVVFGGEALEPQMLEPWMDRFGDTAPRLINMYGITETTVHVTYRPITRADLGTRSPIGEPIPDLRVYVLDQRLQPVPIGIAGEICVGGDGVALGYWQRPELNEARFVANPFGHGRLYKSGDLGRYRANGDIEYLGRLDHQVKVRGFRIELGEIEAAVTSHPGVRQALVIAERRSGDTRLVAYTATNESVSSLRRHLQARLPEYMVPAAIVTLDTFPLTPHGKIDRAALPSIDTAASVPADDDTATPWSDLESTIGAIFNRELGIERSHRAANFFDLGAHSLMLINVHAALQEQLGRTFSLTALYRYPSIEQLAAFLQGASTAAAPATTADADDRAAKRRQARQRASERRHG